MVSVSLGRAWHGTRFAAVAISVGLVLMSTDSFGSVLQYRSISLMRALTTSGSCLGCFAGFEGLAAAADDPAASDRREMPSSISNATPTAASRPDRARPRTVRRAQVESRGLGAADAPCNATHDPRMLHG